MNNIERDKRLHSLLEKYFIPYEFTKEEIDFAAKQLADEIDRGIINAIITAAQNNERKD